MTDSLQQLEDWVAPLLQQLKPAERARLARKLGTALRRSQQRRIASQRDPDGTAYAPRRPAALRRAKAGRIKRGAMFIKLRQARYLRVQSSAVEASVGYGGRAARIARIHQEGRPDIVGKNRVKHVYARRKLLGFNPADQDLVRNLLMDHLAPLA